MCTFACLIGKHPRWPLIVLANRDEMRGRPSLPPALWTAPDGQTRVFGGRDAREGGTWLGLNERGLLVALTNQYTPGGPDPTRRSRGLLVAELLALPDPAAVRARLESLDPAVYNRFNLFAGNADSALSYAGFPAGEIRELGPDILVLGNDHAHATGGEKRRRVTETLQTIGPGEDAPAAFARLERLARNTEGVFEVSTEGIGGMPICIESPGYGTVSGDLILLGRDAADTHWRHVDTIPTRGEYRTLDLSGLFKN